MGTPNILKPLGSKIDITSFGWFYPLFQEIHVAHMIEYSHHKIVALPWQGMNSGHVGSFVQISRVGHWFGLGATRLKGEKVSQFLFASETGWHRTAGARFTIYCAVSQCAIRFCNSPCISSHSCFFLLKPPSNGLLSKFVAPKWFVQVFLYWDRLGYSFPSSTLVIIPWP
jgi:hypothetical protein